MKYGNFLGVALGVTLGLGVQESWAASAVKTNATKPEAPGWSIAAVDPGITANNIRPTFAAIAPFSNQVAELAPNAPAENLSHDALPTLEPEVFAANAAESPVTAPAAEAIANVSTIDELADVSPGDWAYQALQSLVDDYGCIEGYPDETFRGDRSLTRSEFAAGLDKCLSEVQVLAGLNPLAGEGLLRSSGPSIQRLQAEFREELDLLTNRVDILEAETAELRTNAFSTTTRLRGEVVFSLEQLLGGDKANGSGDDLPETLVFGSRARLNFNTSFTGRDLLKIRLDALEPNRFNVPVTGTNMTRLAFDRTNNNDFDIGKFFYRFPVGDRLSLHIDAARGAYQGNVSSTFNPGLANPISGVVSRFGRFNPIYYQGALGTGITGVYDLAPNLAFSAGYLSRAPGSNNPDDGGLFGSGYTALAQLDYRPTESWRLGLAYARSSYPAGNVAVAAGTGSRLANAPFGGNVATSANHLGLQSTLKLGSANLSGWAGLSFATAESDRGVVDEGDDATLLNWAVTLGLPNLGGQGNLGGLVVGNPPRVLSNSGGADEDDSTWHLEAFYRYRVTQNISLIPGFFVLINPENNSANDTIWVGSFRTVFEF
ncbi:MAG: iron uptake porin [Leptolyngbya sp. SIOISBB]|nr:iron uptake porin [Leptolyngbya sp. SIOISBB]